MLLGRRRSACCSVLCSVGGVYFNRFANATIRSRSCVLDVILWPFSGHFSVRVPFHRKELKRWAQARVV